MTLREKSEINQAAAQMGRKGGQSGRGQSKKRGNVSYYRDMQRKSVASRLRNAAKPAAGNKKS